mmetsp:Transcript_74839/g.180912  ORF Transcript_74839/g.180912 Transcript_74839/m.180912 type:complete len:284 (+) Transcript_74839:473-1324(+)
MPASRHFSRRVCCRRRSAPSPGCASCTMRRYRPRAARRSPCCDCSGGASQRCRARRRPSSPPPPRTQRLRSPLRLPSAPQVPQVPVGRARARARGWARRTTRRPIPSCAACCARSRSPLFSVPRRTTPRRTSRERRSAWASACARPARLTRAPRLRRLSRCRRHFDCYSQPAPSPPPTCSAHAPCWQRHGRPHAAHALHAPRSHRPDHRPDHRPIAAHGMRVRSAACPWCPGVDARPWSRGGMDSCDLARGVRPAVGIGLRADPRGRGAPLQQREHVVAVGGA